MNEGNARFYARAFGIYACAVPTMPIFEGTHMQILQEIEDDLTPRIMEMVEKEKRPLMDFLLSLKHKSQVTMNNLPVCPKCSRDTGATVYYPCLQARMIADVLEANE